MVIKNRFITHSIWRHYKGGLYKTIGIATHTETLEKFVLYHSLDKPHQLWIKPESMYLDTKLNHSNKKWKQFTKI